MNPSDLLLSLAREQGFLLAGITSAEPSAHLPFLRRWLEEGRHGTMAWMARPDALARRADLRGSLPGVRSVLVVADACGRPDPPEVRSDPSVGVIARYARGRDYHRLLKGRLTRVHRAFEAALDRPCPGRIHVDTGPLLERELAARAGLGWFGRNTMLIHPRHGSYFLLGALLLEEALDPRGSPVEDHCGSCRACLDACPTGALLGRDETGAPVLDARLCISYLTIESRDAIPVALRPAIGNRVFGCDICQEVCPFSVRFAREPGVPGYAARGPGESPAGVEALPGDNASANVSGRRPAHPGTGAPSLLDLMETSLDPDRWDAFSRGSPIRRAGREGFARNVAVALGNWLRQADEPPPAALDVLRVANEDEAPLVREHAAWALQQAHRRG